MVEQDNQNEDQGEAEVKEDWRDAMGREIFEDDPNNPGQIKMKILTAAQRKNLDQVWETNARKWTMDNKVQLKGKAKKDEKEREQKQKRANNRNFKLNRKPRDIRLDPRLQSMLSIFPLDNIDRFRFNRNPTKKKNLPQIINQQNEKPNEYDTQVFGRFDAHSWIREIREEKEKNAAEKRKRVKYPSVNIWGKIDNLNRPNKIFTPKAIGRHDPYKNCPEVLEKFPEQIYNPYGIPSQKFTMFERFWYKFISRSNLLKSQQDRMNAKDGEFKLKLLHQILHKDIQMDTNHERVAIGWINDIGKLNLFHDLRQFLKLNRFKQICSYRKCTGVVKRYEDYEYSTYRGDERLQVDQPNYFKGDDCQYWPFGRWLAKQKRKWRMCPENWRTISWREISYHRFPNDCWTSIKDRVFDITGFLQKHPGGEVPLRQVFGKDGTWTFLGVHPYIVFYDKLAGFEIGRSPDFRPHQWTYFEPHYEWDGIDLFGYWLIKPRHPLHEYYPVQKFTYNNKEICYSVGFPGISNTTADHWMFSVFKKQNIIIRFYIKGSDMWLGNFLLPIRLVDPRPEWKFENNFNKLTLTLQRPLTDQKPKRLGRIKGLEDHGLFFNTYSFDEYYPAWIMQIAWLSDDRILLTVGYNSPNFFGCPIGFHVNFKFVVNKRTVVIRPYTPICFPIVEDPKMPLKPRESHEPGKLYFLIRLQTDGEMGSLLHECTGIPTGARGYGYLYISSPRGNFDVSFMYDDMDIMLLIAGGTGISIFTRIIQDYMKNRKLLENKKVILMYHCRKKKDHVFNKTWNWLAKELKWFHYFPIITKPDNIMNKSNVGEKNSVTDISLLGTTPEKLKKTVKTENTLKKGDLWGHPGQKQIRKVLLSVEGCNDPEKQLKIMVCGPYLFSHWADLSIAQMKITDPKNVWFFQGATTYEELKSHQVV